MSPLTGGCHCGSIAVEVALSGAASSYAPRACDCDFCRKHGAAYVSDPRGSLLLQVRESDHLGHYRQGSGSAEMLVCRHCGVLLGALYREPQSLLAAVNVRVLEACADFAAPHPVSPQTLSAAQKVQRWRELWFADVRIRTER
jgi:hypothetical protein